MIFFFFACVFPKSFTEIKMVPLPPGFLTVGADSAGGSQMLFKSNSMSDQATQGRLVLHYASRPFNAILLFINQSADVFPPFTLKALHCGNQ